MGSWEIHVTGLEAVNAAFTELKKRCKDQTLVWRLGAEILQERKEEVFASQGGREPWRPLAWSTLVDRAQRSKLLRSKGIAYLSGKRRGQFRPQFTALLRGHKILQRTGNLKRRISTRAWSGGCQIGSNVEYARIHQLGGDAGRGHKTHIPARPFLQVYPEDLTELAIEMGEYLASSFVQGGPRGFVTGTPTMGR